MIGSTTPGADHSFQLYDLRVEVICPPGKRIMCGAKADDYFTMEGEMLRLPPGQGFSIYSLGAVLPLLAAKQRVSSPYDWMSSDSDVACPDPNCPSKLRITRTGLRTFRRGDTTVTPLPDTAAPSPNVRELSQSLSVSDEVSIMTVEPDTPRADPASPLFTDVDAEEVKPVEETSAEEIGVTQAEDLHDLRGEADCNSLLDYLRADWG
ncbi:uncharacterized protein B0H18DRAFT_892714 [Fomitopsis serialis]|uniref:uncharacterized protein n=1 Tax=Fomitopsis serialis TaxID=139415 RepID=UPI002007D8F8|nr:uncharacterized protein B0H18DRAFT_892714 [Neoantrodia serialis]KAH9911502.1 hypothetical protein B0H18DRAFT_892714 [Neoantrodia serialis]